MQRNWIGKSKGRRLKFNDIEVFTTRPDTLDGATFVVLSPEYKDVQKYITQAQRKSCEDYIKKAARKSDIERTGAKTKTGVFTGSYVTNPLNNEKVPVWIADYVLVGYGTGAIMAVPHLDDRDREFAEKFNLPIKKITPKDNSVGCAETSYRLRDWSIGRQRYWGCPIPIVYCDKCGTVAETRLPVILPHLKDFKPKGSAPLGNDPEFVKCTCPKCGAPTRRETETMDTFVCSSFYFLRFLDPENKTELISKAADKKFMPVDKYVGGAEHACMHLLYARFIMRFLHKAGFVNTPEPFKSLVHQGMILGADGRKMSKSLGNVIDPDKYVAEYGSDVLRLYLLFGFNYLEGGPWNDAAFRSTVRYIDRVTNLIEKCKAGAPNAVGRIQNNTNLLTTLNKTIVAVTTDLETFSFNTAVARCMELTNAMYEYAAAANPDPALLSEALNKLILMLAPMLPHFGEEWYHTVNPKAGSVFDESFPKADKKYLTDASVEIVAQINSKIVGRLTVPTDADEKSVAALCAEFLSGRTPKKTIYVKNKLINFIV